MRIVCSGWIALGCLFVPACSGGGGGGGPSLAFAVESTSPPALALDHEPGDPVRLTFNAPVDQNSLSTATVYLRGVAGLVASTVAYDAATQRVDIVPSTGLIPGASYTVIVESGLLAADGTRLGTEFRFTFGTADRRVWTPVETIASNVNRVLHVSADALGGLHLLLGESSAGGSSWYLRTTPNGQFLPSELLPAGTNPIGFDLAANGAVVGALLIGTPGQTMTRIGGMWSLPVDIPVQPPPSTLMPGDRWPDPFAYVFSSGGATSGAIRVGPRVPTLAGVPEPRCKVISATRDIDAPFALGEEVWGAIVGPGSADCVIGATVTGDPVAWVWRPGDPNRTPIGVHPSGAQNWLTRMESNAWGDVAAAWVHDLSPDHARPPFEVEFVASRYAAATRSWSQAESLARIATNQPSPQLATAIAPTGDATVAWSLIDATGNRLLEVAHYRAPGVGVSAPGWTRSTFSDEVSDSTASFAVAHDASGHAFVAWIDVELGDRKLWLRQFDLRRGWLDPQLMAESTTDTIRELRLVADANGRVVMVWNQRENIVLRRFRQ